MRKKQMKVYSSLACKTFLLAAMMCVFTVSLVNATTYYVATTGSNSWGGTQAQPFGTLQKAADVVAAGDTVFIRGGTYSITTPVNSGAGISISKSGASESKRIYFWAYPGELPVFDFAKLAIQNGNYTHGIVVTGSFLHFKGFEIKNVPMNTKSNCGMHVDNAEHDIFELIKFHHNNGAGVFVSKGTGGHLFLNCDAYDNYDPGSNQGDGQNADGFGCHYQTTGDTTKYIGCRAWWNSDDGWDLISQEFPVIIENSFAMGCGLANYGTSKPSSGNGNGFKAGSSKTGIRHIIRNCVAWKNTAAGFYANHSAGGNDWYNNTAYSNGTQFNLLASSWDANDNRTDGVTLSGAKAHVMRNNIGYPNKNSNMNGVDSKNNTWDLAITPADKDFWSVSDPSMTLKNQTMETMAGALGPRNKDGSLPDIAFMKLVAGSQMIDKGIDVKLLFAGKAPDLGAYEFELASSVIPYTKGAQPFSLLQSKRNEQNVFVFDMTGKRLDKNKLAYTLKPVVYMILQPDGHVQARKEIRMR